MGRIANAIELHPLERVNLGFSAGGLAVAVALASPAFAASYALGAVLEAINFRALRIAAGRLLSGQLAGAPLWSVIFGMRLAILLASMAIALVAGAHPLGLLLGVSTVVPAVLAGAWWLRPPVDPSAPRIADDDPAWEHWSVWRGDVVLPEAEDEETA
jgi:hypothetical protein